MLPLYVVERIEILNGPGGVLYGTNAFAGVVSITTKREGRSMRFNSGSFRTVGGGVEASAPGVYVATDQQMSGGFSPALNSDGKAYGHPQDRDRTFGMLKLEHGGLHGSASVTRHKFADAYRQANQHRFWMRSPIFGSLGYDKKIGDDGSVSVQRYYEDYDVYRDKIRYTSTGQLRDTTRSTLGSKLYGVDLTGSYRWGAHTLVAGSSLQGDKDTGLEELTFFPTPGSSPGLAVAGVHRHTLGTFVEDVWSLNEYLDITAGVRYDYLSAFKDQLSYRAGLTGQRGVFYGKLLYGTAFRVPSYREYLEKTSYNFALKPEHSQTLEAQAGIAFTRGDINLTLYNNHYSDLIKELFVTEIQQPGGTQRINDEYSINANRSTVTGLEFQASLYPTDRMTASVGASTILRDREKLGVIDPSLRLSTAVTEGEAEVPFLSHFAANALYSVQLSRTGHRAGVNASWVSRRDTPPEYQQKVPEAVRNPANADGFFKLDLFGANPLSRQFVLNLKATNLFNRKIYTPNFDDPTGYDTQWPGRAFRFELVWRY